MASCGGGTGDAKVFALLDPGESTSSATEYAALDSVDGLAFRAAWSRMEPTANTYDWASLDAITDVVRQADKKLTIHVISDAPAWLTGLGMQSYSYNHPLFGSGSAPIPWDATFLDRNAKFMAALAAHVLARGDADLIEVVSVGAPVSEMSLLYCQNGLLGNSLSYDRSSYLESWKNSISAYDSAFSDAAFDNMQLVFSAPVSQICRPDADGLAFYTELMESILPTTPRAGVFMADLNALGSSRLNQVGEGILAQVPLYFQTIWSYSNDPSDRFKGPLMDAVCFGRNAGARYFEIYKADLLSTDLAVQSAIAAVRTGDGCGAI